ncbi:MAG: hypothetical protein AAGG38_14765, partial [Planctomycetota bacterium]
DPPARLHADGHAWQRREIYKHDAFAATALYARQDAPEHLAVAKFARLQPAFGVPFRWLGRWFHQREQRVYRRLAGTPGVPALLGPITVDHQPWPHAALRRYVPGRPLTLRDRPPDHYFPQLQALIGTFHQQRVAVVDLNKIDNLLIDPHGNPHLIDFQISLAPAQHPPILRGLDPRAWLLPACRRADRYHLMKHWVRRRPDQLTPDQLDLDQYRPHTVRLWRKLIRPLHLARRKLFVALQIRTGRGDPDTEIAPDARPPLSPDA